MGRGGGWGWWGGVGWGGGDKLFSDSQTLYILFPPIHLEVN